MQLGDSPFFIFEVADPVIFTESVIVYVGWTEDVYLEGGSNPTASGILNL